MKSRKNRKFAHGLSSKEFLSNINSTYGLKITPNQFVTVVLNLEKGKYNVDPLQDFLHMFLYTNPLIASKCILQNIFQSKGCISCKNERLKKVIFSGKCKCLDNELNDYILSCLKYFQTPDSEEDDAYFSEEGTWINQLINQLDNEVLDYCVDGEARDSMIIGMNDHGVNVQKLLSEKCRIDDHNKEGDVINLMNMGTKLLTPNPRYFDFGGKLGTHMIEDESKDICSKIGGFEKGKFVTGVPINLMGDDNQNIEETPDNSLNYIDVDTNNPYPLPRLIQNTGAIKVNGVDILDSKIINIHEAQYMINDEMLYTSNSGLLFRPVPKSWRQTEYNFIDMMVVGDVLAVLESESIYLSINKDSWITLPYDDKIQMYWTFYSLDEKSVKDLYDENIEVHHHIK